jgi:hypothetical protein
VGKKVKALDRAFCSGTVSPRVMRILIFYFNVGIDPECLPLLRGRRWLRQDGVDRFWVV